MKLENPKSPKFYTSRKKKQGNPGRLAANSVNSHTSNLSKFIDYYLQPHVKNQPSYIKDTLHFIKKVKDIHEDTRDTILVSMNVKSLYTNIFNHENIEAVKKKTNAQTQKPIATNDVMVKFLFLILTLNNVIFNSISYLQKWLRNGNHQCTIIYKYFDGNASIYTYNRNKKITY